ncbi:hypothetical protein KGA66_13680 [Actinocrinis puniceicyclus]|uniref:Lipoprotein n=1 Tax=Actinocrinis puniceicyclus TaxID=977794 RepID=A0A8J8BCF5_9ACTN|nr:hypothetical protein [Actinocrinis puniceicyclus]MBS2964103.1 hypothetical protein [Actinocrinis puniceicyclus]
MRTATRNTAARFTTFATFAAVLGGCLAAAGCATGSGTPVAATKVSVTATPPAAEAASGPAGGNQPSTSASTTAAPFPVACTSVSSQGTFVSPGPGQVSLGQISRAVGFTVETAMPDTQSALGFHGYENCRYQFSTPSGGGQLDVWVVIGTDPTTTANEPAAREFADTKTQAMPRSQRGCTGDCAWTVSPTPGLGDSALTLTQSGDSVVVALKGNVYVEVGPGDFKVERELSLARVLLANLH